MKLNEVELLDSPKPFVLGPDHIAKITSRLRKANIDFKRYTLQMIRDGQAPMTENEAYAKLREFEPDGIGYITPNIIESRVPTKIMHELTCEVQDKSAINRSSDTYHMMQQNSA